MVAKAAASRTTSIPHPPPLLHCDAGPPSVPSGLQGLASSTHCVPSRGREPLPAGVPGAPTRRRPLGHACAVERREGGRPAPRAGEGGGRGKAPPIAATPFATAERGRRRLSEAPVSNLFRARFSASRIVFLPRVSRRRPAESPPFPTPPGARSHRPSARLCRHAQE